MISSPKKHTLGSRMPICRAGSQTVVIDQAAGHQLCPAQKAKLILTPLSLGRKTNKSLLAVGLMACSTTVANNAEHGFDRIQVPRLGDADKLAQLLQGRIVQLRELVLLC
jgi:hypothetical protein